MDDYITVVEVDDPTSKDTNPIQQLVKRQSSIPEDSSFITVLTINNNNHNINNINKNNNNNNNNYNNNEGSLNDASKDMNNYRNESETQTYERNELSSFNVNRSTNNSNSNSNFSVNNTTINNDINKANNINNFSELETVIVYRLPGERLGFGLKFQGGTRSTEKVQKLYIQSCAKDSPASKVATSWGLLREGDEIVSIDGQMVSDMTRIECVRGLKDNVAIKLEVRNGHGQKPLTTEEELCEMQQRFIAADSGSGNHIESIQNGSRFFVSNSQKLPPPPSPPPVPPRKLVKRNSLKEQLYVTTDIAPNSLDLNSSSLVNKPFTPPPDAEYYINLFADGQSLKTESESDDTASTISTVIDKFSLNSSNYSSETDLSSYASLTNGGTDLTKVLKPFTIIEQEFKVVTPSTATSNSQKPCNIILGNNYENVDLKTEKINVYENVEFNINGENEPKPLELVEQTTKAATPTPKPRQVISATTSSITAVATTTTTPSSSSSTSTSVNATIEPKKRSILPMPRKLTGSPIKLPIEVAPPKIPEPKKQNEEIVNYHSTTITNEIVKTPPTSTITTTPVNTSTTTPSSTPSKEFITKIPKAIASVFSPNSQRNMERAKTETEIKLSVRQRSSSSRAIIQQTALFLEAENKVFSPMQQQLTATTPSKTSPFIKSRIPVIASIPKRAADYEAIATPTTPTTPTTPNNCTEKRSIGGSPSNIPRMLMQKQKSETDLKLGYYRSKSKETSPVLNNKTPLMRTLSAESKFRTPERTLIPVLSASTNSLSSTESISSSSMISNVSSNGKPKGPKPKPPERVQSLQPKQATQIPKFQQHSTISTTSVLTNQQPQQHHYQAKQIPTMQTFKQQTSPIKTLSPQIPLTTMSSPSRGIRFKIQTYESKVQTSNSDEQMPLNAAASFVDVNGNEHEKMPSLFDLMHSGKPNEHQDTPIKIPIKDMMIDDDAPMLDRETPPPMVIGKCIKLTDDGQQATYYSSSSSEDDGEESVDDVGKDYDCEDGEKLGPPEVINGPGPSEAYFNLYWHSNMLPTIGEVAEEDLSSLEQSLSNGPIVVVDDLTQHKAAGSPLPEKTVKATAFKSKKSQFIGVPVLPPTIPDIDLERNLLKTKTKMNATENVAVGVVMGNQPLTANNSGNKTEDEDKDKEKYKQNINELNDDLIESSNNESSDDKQPEKPNIDFQNTFVESTMFDEDGIKTSKDLTSSEIIDIVEEQNAKTIEDEILNDKIVEDNINVITEVTEITDQPKSETELATKLKSVQSITEKEINEQQEHESTAISTVTKTKSSKLITQEEQQEETEENIAPVSSPELEKKSETKHIKKTTKKKVIKTSTSTTSTISSSSSLPSLPSPSQSPSSLLHNSNVELNDALNKNLNNLPIEVNSTKTPTTESTSPSIAFTLQPYTERHPENSKITVMEERQYESTEQAYMKMRTFTSDGDEKLQHSTETHRERAKLKKIHNLDGELLDNIRDNENDLTPLTITAVTAETRITESVKDPQDNQSIEGGILHLSESGKQLQRNEAGVLVGMVECDHQVLDTYEDVTQKKILAVPKTSEAEKQEPITLLREVSENLILTKDGEKQVTRRSEATMSQLPTTSTPKTTVTPMSTPAKKVAKLVKKTEDEKRLEREARELIENYQKVKKEAEKLFQNDIEKHIVNDDDGNGFDLDDVESINATQSMMSTSSISPSIMQNTLYEFLAAERAHALQPIVKSEPNAYLLHQHNHQKQEQEQEQELCQTGNETAIGLPPALPTSAIPDLLIETEPLYVLHKNIIDETPVQSIVETNIKLSTKPIPQRRGLVTNENQINKKKQIKTQKEPMLTKKVPIASSDFVDHSTVTNAMEIHSPVEPIDERIIVGVEHQLELPVKMTAPTTTIDSSTKTAPAAAAAAAPAIGTYCVGGNTGTGVSRNCTVTGTTPLTTMVNSNSLHLESINLTKSIPPTTKTKKPIQASTIVSTSSSSADSVQSVIENMQQATATLERLSLNNNYTDVDLLAADVQDVQHKAKKMNDDGSPITPPPHGPAPPPAYSRLPPDGHEFPPNFCEPADIGAILIKSQLSNNKNGNSVSNNNATEVEMEIHMEKKHSFIDSNSRNNNSNIITTTTTTAIASTNSSSSSSNSSSINNKNASSNDKNTRKNCNEMNSGLILAAPPPLPKTVPPPPPPVTKPRKIFREKLIVNIDDAREISNKSNHPSIDFVEASVKTTPQMLVTPRRSSSTQNLSAMATTASTSSSGGSTPTTHKLEQPDFPLREIHSKRSWASRKPSNWHKDEKSERSVRDKIAMFSMDDSGSSMSGSTPHLNSGSSGNGSGSGSGGASNTPKSLNWSSENLLETNSSGSRITAFPSPHDNTLNLSGSNTVGKSNNNKGGGDFFDRTTNGIFTTRALSMENLYASPNDNTIISGMSGKQQHEKLSKYSESLQSLDTMPSYYASLPRRQVVHSHQIERRTSFSGGQMSEEASRKVANLLEHRRRSITKLRGLVIPERPSTLEPILDLPEIKSRDSEHTNINDYSTDSGIISKGNSNASNSIMYTSVATTRAIENLSYNNSQKKAASTPTQCRAIELPPQPPQPPAKPPRTSLSTTLSNVSPPSGSIRPPALLSHDESDSDSVFSSKVSSPPMSPMGAGSLGSGISGTTSHGSSMAAVVPEKFALTRTLSSETNTSIASSTTSTLTSGSGSQASCSSVGSTPTVDLSRRIIKSAHTSANSAASNDTNAVAAAAAASRRNILASAKCRSGRGESSLLRQRSQAPYHDDEDSTDGYDEEEVRRVAHKTRSRSNLLTANSLQSNSATVMLSTHTHASSKTPNTTHVASSSTSSTSATSTTLVNYKLVSQNHATTAVSASAANSLVDRVINVAAYVEVTTASDTDDSSHKSDAANATSPSKISAIFIDEERKASFKAPVVDTDILKAATSPSLNNAKVANAQPAKVAIAQQAETPPVSPKNPVAMSVPPPKRTTADISSSSSEMHQWVQSEMAKSTNRAINNINTNAKVAKSSGTLAQERSLKPVLAKFERASSTCSNMAATTVVSKHLTKPMTSTAELRERFERNANTTASKVNPTKQNIGSTTSTGNSYLDRFSSLDSVASSSSGVSSSTQNVSTHEHNDFGSFSSLGSNQSLITAQDLWQIMEEADPPLKHREAFIVVLQRDTPESTVGITLAGGADYETKEVTVNKVLADSPAARDGRLRKGDRILAVNGMSMRGLTHNESVSVLKAPRPEVTLVVTRSESLVVEAAPKKRYTLGSLTSLLEKPIAEQQFEKKQRKSYHSASRSLDIGLDSVATGNEIENPKENNAESKNSSTLRSSSSSTSSSPSASSTDCAGSSYKQDKNDKSAATSSTLGARERKVIVSKDYCGLGFSLEGGFDSPVGNRPLLIRKVFYGGAAHKTGQIKPGDEIIAINGLSTIKMTRIEVWNLMNQLPVGDVEMVLQGVQ